MELQDGAPHAQTGTSRVSRAEFLKKSAGAGAGLVLSSALAPSALAAPKARRTASKKTVTIVFATYGGPYQDAQTAAWLNPFMEKHPHIKVATDAFDNSKLIAMTKSGRVTWDVVDVGADNGTAESQIFTPLDTKAIKAWAQPVPGIQNSPYRIGELITTYVLAWNTQATNGKSPQTWADFFDLNAFPGKRTLRKLVDGGALEFALLADGVRPSKLYPLDLDRAFNKLDTIKSQIVWWDTGTLSQQLLGDGEVALGALWAARVMDLETRLQKPVAMTWHQHLMYGSYFAIPKGSKHVPEATLLIEWMTDPKNNAKLSWHYPDAPATLASIPRANPDEEDWFATSHLAEAVPKNDNWWGQNITAVNQRFQEWFVS